MARCGELPPPSSASRAPSSSPHPTCLTWRSDEPPRGSSSTPTPSPSLVSASSASPASAVTSISSKPPTDSAPSPYVPHPELLSPPSASPSSSAVLRSSPRSPDSSHSRCSAFSPVQSPCLSCGLSDLRPSRDTTAFVDLRRGSRRNRVGTRSQSSSILMPSTISKSSSPSNRVGSNASIPSPSRISSATASPVAGDRTNPWPCQPVAT